MKNVTDTIADENRAKMRQMRQIAIERSREKFNHGCIGFDCDLCVGIETGVDTAIAISTDHTANDDTFPSEIVFPNGCKVGIAFNGDKPYLTVTKETNVYYLMRADVLELIDGELK